EPQKAKARGAARPPRCERKVSFGKRGSKAMGFALLFTPAILFRTPCRGLCRFLLSRRLGLRMPAASGGMLNLGVDFSADEESKTCDVEPHQEDHGRAQRAVGLAVVVEEVQVGAETE